MNSIFQSIQNGINTLRKSILSPKTQMDLEDLKRGLEDNLKKNSIIDELRKLPKDTIFYINEIEEEYFDCRILNTSQKQDIPKELVYKPEEVTDRDKLKLQEDGLFHSIK